MLKLDNVSLCYEKDTEVLHDIGFQVNAGECLLLTGESGSGKSSLINVINGLAHKYDNAYITGSIQVDGQEIKDLELYEIAWRIASVFQNPKSHFFHVNTTQELLFHLENIGLDRPAMKARMEDMLKIFPTEHLLERSIFELSGGEKQVLCVASCYISGCKMIVLDEPTSNLDGQYIDILQDMLAILKSKGITLIIAEHRMYYLMDIVDRIVLINKGRIGHIFDRDEFLSVSKGALEEWGIRSIYKVSLDDKAKQGGQDLSDGLYQYIQAYAFYDDVSGESLFHNLKQVYNKMLSFKALGYPSLKEAIPQSAPMVQITNTNENKVDINISFSDVRKEIEDMSALPDVEIEEILNKINELEKIVKSSDRKSKKWENAKGIVKWIADKGVDVGIALLPLLLQIK